MDSLSNDTWLNGGLIGVPPTEVEKEKEADVGVVTPLATSVLMAAGCRCIVERLFIDMTRPMSAYFQEKDETSRDVIFFFFYSPA